MTRNLLTGSATFVIGLLLWLFTGDIEIPVVTLTKAGVVLMVIGAAEVGYGLYRAVRGPRPARR
ncbi:DUF5708 family protein [Actinoplanes teichomyceticus]|uniref:Uncharacterized protein n=1 Tax=Actinoplanes teichomyceticus TaxID=1867 RepID=A0A561WJK2_ACTTI|nr:DUF5708 family protein [Actinoplanes teichomyceticus]TWG24051.1 hypothetical protein FHX34_102604 [Actinoplanes teichomyceticus]GIF12092.1 hypothetical protein Ate01nite_21240 [Actinoplanes teichomyceticus]